MDQINLYFLKNELLEIIEDIQSEIISERDYLLLKIALVHLLVGYSNKNGLTHADNLRINYLMLKYSDKITEYKRKYKL